MMLSINLNSFKMRQPIDGWRIADGSTEVLTTSFQKKTSETTALSIKICRNKNVFQ